MKNTPKLPRVMYGNLTAREHAIVLAHRWQLAHVNATDPNTRDAYNAIVGLLGQLPYTQVQRAIQKADATEGEPR